MKKYWTIIFTLLFAFALSACGEKTDTDTLYGNITGTNYSQQNSISATQSPQVQEESDTGSYPHDYVQGKFDASLFAGKVKSCAYAGNDKIIVLSDKLYLYDTQSGVVLAETEPPLEFFEVYAFEGGYLLTGFSSNGATACFYNENLSLTKEIITMDLLKEDFVTMESGIAISSDGKKLALAGTYGLYVYDLENENIERLLVHGDRFADNSMEIVTFNSVTFLCENTQIAYCGQGRSISDTAEDELFSICGTVSVNGDHLNIAKPSDYVIDTNDIQNRVNRIFMPQEISEPGDFVKNTASLKWLDSKTGLENQFAFSSGDEGCEGVYSSEQGTYAATAVLGESLIIRIYEVSSGSLIHTEEIENPDKTYFYRIPQIYLFDNSKTALVLLGGGIQKLDTLVSTFTFGA